MKIYLVGGAVRDQLLNRPVKDRDWVVVGATPQTMLDLNYQQVGQDFPVFLHPETKEEYALARTERKSGHGYGGFEFDFTADVTLEEDLIRRDLTINAIAQDDEGNLIDPYGGLEDLKNKRLKHVSPSFAEDPLRVLRVARFAARYHSYGFVVAEETLKLMAGISQSGELEHLTPERVWQETERALGEDHPEVYFQVLRDCGALKVCFPELDNLFGVPQPEKHHPEIDTGVHTLMVLEQATVLSKDTVTRFAALVHDLGKAATDPELWPKHHGHEKLSADLVRTMVKRLKIPNQFRDLGLLAAEYHTHCHRAFELTAKTLQKTLKTLDSSRKQQRFENFLIACEADSKGRTGFETNPYPQKDYFLAANKVLQSVQPKDVIVDGFEGAAISEEITRRQVIALQAFKDNYPAP